MRATQLEDCKKILVDSSDELASAKNTLKTKIEHFETLKSERDKWKKKHEFHKTLNEKQDRLKDVRKELASSLLKRALEEHKLNIDALQRIDARISECQSCIDDEDTDKKAIQTEKDVIEAEKALEEKLASLRDPIE